MKTRKPNKTRNPIAKALRTLRPKRVSDQRLKLRERAENIDLDALKHRKNHQL